MALAKEDIEYIKAHLGDWLAEQSLGKPPVVYEIELRERMVRVEEELKHQRELMHEGFKRMDQRFDEQRSETNKRFEQADRRFEQVEKRLEEQRIETNKHFDEQRAETAKRFDEALKRQDKHFLWLLGFIASSLGILLAALRFMA